MSRRTYDVVIAGSGIVGAACAYELSAARLSVAIVDEHGVGSGATNAGMGHLLVLDDSDAQFALTRYSLELWEPLFHQLPPECEFWRCGTVWVAADEEELQFAARRCEYYRQNGVSAELLSPAELSALEPNLRPGLVGGALVPNDASLVPSMAARFLIKRAQENGTELIEGHRVIEINDEGVRLSDGTRLLAHACVNATGTAAAALTPGLPIRSRKGHILVVKLPHHFARHQVVELGYLKSAHASEEADSVAFNVRQRKNGELLIGSSRQYGAGNPAVEPGMLRRMLDRAVEFMPTLAAAPQVTSWTGFRAGTPDGLPLIGLVPESNHVYAATGQEGLGATTSIATARLLTDEILRRPTGIAAAAFSPARFATKER